MKAFIARFAIQTLLKFLLSRLPVDRLLDTVSEAEDLYSDQFSKRGHVVRVLKEVEGEKLSTASRNLAVELGYHLYKTKKGK